LATLVQAIKKISTNIKLTNWTIWNSLQTGNRNEV